MSKIRGMSSAYHGYLLERAQEYYESEEYAELVAARRKQVQRDNIWFVLEWGLGVVLIGIGVASAGLLLADGFAVLPAIGLVQGLVVGRAMASAILFD